MISLRQEGPEPPLAISAAGAVLVVDDDPDTRFLIVEMLQLSGIRCIQASNGAEALAKLAAHPNAIDAVVLDVVMPEMTGFDVANQVKRVSVGPTIPVILLSATAKDDMDIVHGVESGAVDYLFKPCSMSVLAAKVGAACQRTREERQIRDELRFAKLHATTDSLTGLFNRSHLTTRIREAVAHARRHVEPFAIVMMDLDNFKAINDRFGHEEGDRVLVHFASAIRGVMRTEDAAFRYGGEEFLLLLRACNAQRGVEVVKRLRDKLGSRPFAFSDGSSARIAFSAGVTNATPDNAFAGEALIGQADAALYQAKSRGRDTILTWAVPLASGAFRVCDAQEVGSNDSDESGGGARQSG